jgi:hypothetical protein
VIIALSPTINNVVKSSEIFLMRRLKTMISNVLNVKGLKDVAKMIPR